MSTLSFTYNLGAPELANRFVNQEDSPKPGLSTATLYNLQSPNLNIQGLTLTLQINNNIVTPPADANSSLLVYNGTIVVSTTTNTIGILTYTAEFQNPVPRSILNGISRSPKISTYVTSASGLLANYLFGNVIIQYDNRETVRLPFFRPNKKKKRVWLKSSLEHLVVLVVVALSAEGQTYSAKCSIPVHPVCIQSTGLVPGGRTRRPGGRCRESDRDGSCPR